MEISGMGAEIECGEDDQELGGKWRDHAVELHAKNDFFPFGGIFSKKEDRAVSNTIRVAEKMMNKMNIEKSDVVIGGGIDQNGNGSLNFQINIRMSSRDLDRESNDRNYDYDRRDSRDRDYEQSEKDRDLQ